MAPDGRVLEAEVTREQARAAGEAGAPLRLAVRGGRVFPNPPLGVSK